MRRRGLAGAALAAWVLAGPGGTAVADDRGAAPPALEVVTSPGGVFSFEIAVQRPLGAPLAAARATGTLRRDGAVVWRRALGQPVRPRFAVVDDAGRVALFGRWENTAEDMAVEVLGPDGAVVATLGRAEIEAAVGLPASRIVAAARLGAWLDRVPVVADGVVTLGAAGRALVLDLADGRLRAAQP